MDRRAELERELRERHGDYDLWQIYADLVAETDELWGSWIQLNIAGERGGRTEAERQDLRMAIGDRDVYGPELRALLDHEPGAITSRLRIITLERGFAGHAELDLVGEPSPLDLFLEHPASRFLRRFDLHMFDDAGEQALEHLATHPLESLRELSIEARATIADATDLHANVFRAAPRLQRFHVTEPYRFSVTMHRDGRITRD